MLDVREKEEYAEDHIPGAVNIYVGEREKRLAIYVSRLNPINAINHRAHRETY